LILLSAESHCLVENILRRRDEVNMMVENSGNNLNDGRKFR